MLKDYRSLSDLGTIYCAAISNRWMPLDGIVA